MNTTHLIAVIAVAMALNTWVMIAGKKAFKRSWYMLWRIVTAPFRFTYNTVRSHWVITLFVLLAIGLGVFQYAEYESEKYAKRMAAYNHYDSLVRKSEEQQVYRNWVFAPVLEGQPHGDRTLEDE